MVVMRGLLSLIIAASAAFAHADYADAKAHLKAKEFTQALAEFQTLGKLGSSDASLQAATLLAKKQSETYEPLEAYAWYVLADDQGAKGAARKAKRALRDLAAGDADEAERRARALVEQYGLQTLETSLLPTSYTDDYVVARPGKSPGLRYPNEYRFRMQAGIVFIEFDIDERGIARDYRLLRESPEPFVREAIRFLQGKRFRYRNVHGMVQRIGFYISNRDETPSNYGEAKLLRKLKKRAEQGSPYRKFFYAYAVETHQALHGIVDPAAFNEWYLRAAQAGHAQAQYLIGNRLLRGDTMVRNGAKGMRWLQLSAENGNADAAYLLSMEAEDESTADRYMLQAADAGHTTAMLYLARTLSEQGDNPAAIQRLEAAEDHLDKIRWLETAAFVYRHQPDKARTFIEQGKDLAQSRGMPFKIAGSE